MQNSISLRPAISLLVVCAAFFVFGIFRLNDVSVYTPDSVRYLIWGNSVAHGKGFVDDTQPDPERFVPNAPLYAVLTAPVHLLFPMSIVAVKVYTLLWGAAAMVLVYFWIRRAYGDKAALIAAAIVAANPRMLLLSTEVLSEVPFIALLVLAMLLVEKRVESDGWEKARVLALVVCASFIPLLREVGIALTAALAISFFSRRQIGRAIMVVVPAALLVGLWYMRNSQVIVAGSGGIGTNLSIASRHLLTPETSGILVEFGIRIWVSLKSYASYLGGMILYPLWSPDFANIIVHESRAYQIVGFFLTPGKYLINIIVIVVVGAGFVADVRRSATAILRTVFIVLFILIVCVYPVHDIRFIDPLLPFVIYYLIGGVLWFREKLHVLKRVSARAWAVGAIILIVVPNTIGLQQMVSMNLEYRGSPENFLRYPGVPPVYRFQWQKLGKWIESHLPDSAVIASPFKDITLVAGNRKVLEIDPGTMLPLFESLLRDHHVEYVFATKRWSDLRDFEFVMRESRRFWFEPVTEAPNLMRVHSRLRDPENEIIPHQDFDTSRTSELLRKGRAEIGNGEYDIAMRTLGRAVDRNPDQPDILYQTMVASTMAEDTAGAAQSLHRLLGLTQTMSWTAMARMQFDALRLVMHSRRAADREQRAIGLQKAASLYWQMGYLRRAAELLEPLLSDESGYFVGLLWGLQYHLENGDTVKAHEFFTKARGIDSASTLVQSYGRILAIGDSLRMTESDSVRSCHHLLLATLYGGMDLKEEALDESERAVRYDAKNTEAFLLMGKMFERKGRPRAAMRAYEGVLQLQPQHAEAIARADSLSRALLNN